MVTDLRGAREDVVTLLMWFQNLQRWGSVRSAATILEDVDALLAEVAAVE